MNRDFTLRPPDFGDTHPCVLTHKQVPRLEKVALPGSLERKTGFEPATLTLAR